MEEFVWSAGMLPDTGLPDTAEFEWRAPSNIALVKYWGKYGQQYPSNASLSMTLSQSYTLTSIRFERLEQPAPEPVFTFRFAGEPKPEFEPKIRQFLQRIFPYVSWVSMFRLAIHSDNSFPHSSGIASSASSMAAMALCVMSMEEALTEDIDPLYFFRKASFLARLGSGSACRSIFGGMVSWGEHPELPEGRVEFGSRVDVQLADDFIGMKDAVLLVEEGSKSVSSSAGHGLMDTHPFAAERFRVAGLHLGRLLEALRSGERDEFIKLVEGEALMLHALMLSSSPYYLLLQPNTLAIIQRLWEWRRDTGRFCCFTLDAGANVHLLYPQSEASVVESFIDTDLLPYCQERRWISDRMGSGPKRIVLHND